MTSQNAEEAQSKMQSGLLEIINDVDRSHLRKIQLLMHRCAAKCCENSAASLEDTQSCVDNCAKDVRKAQNLVAQEIGHLQERLHSCVLECERSVGPPPFDEEAANSQASPQMREAFDRCAIKCFDDGRSSALPTLLKRLKTSLDGAIKK